MGLRGPKRLFGTNGQYWKFKPLTRKTPEWTDANALKTTSYVLAHNGYFIPNSVTMFRMAPTQWEYDYESKWTSLTLEEFLQKRPERLLIGYSGITNNGGHSSGIVKVVAPRDMANKGFSIRPSPDSGYKQTHDVFQYYTKYWRGYDYETHIHQADRLYQETYIHKFPHD